MSAPRAVPSALAVSSDGEKVAVLDELVAVDHELEDRAERSARSRLAQVETDDVANAVVAALLALDQEDLAANAASTRNGYVEPTEAGRAHASDETAPIRCPRVAARRAAPGAHRVEGRRRCSRTRRPDRRRSSSRTADHHVEAGCVSGADPIGGAKLLVVSAQHDVVESGLAGRDTQRCYRRGQRVSDHVLHPPRTTFTPIRPSRLQRHGDRGTSWRWTRSAHVARLRLAPTPWNARCCIVRSERVRLGSDDARNQAEEHPVWQARGSPVTR